MSIQIKLEIRSLIIIFAVALLPFVLSAIQNASAGALPKDACALLKPAEIQAALAPNENIGSGVPDTSALPLGVGCKYTWGPVTKEWGKSELTITVIDPAKAYPGTSADLILQGLLMKAKADGSNASVIPGVGDAAIFSFEARPSNATAEAYFKAKDLHLSVQFHGGNLQSKDKLTALLKEAAARL